MQIDTHIAFDIERWSDESDSNMCNVGKIVAKLKIDVSESGPPRAGRRSTLSGNKVGSLKYRKSTDDTIFIRDVEVHDKYQGKGIGTKLYQELCEIIKNCPEIRFIRGEILSVNALKARNRIFGQPLELLDESKSPIELDDALDRLKSTKTTIWTLHSTKRCK